MKKFGIVASLIGMLALGACGGDKGKVNSLLDECKACADKTCYDALEKKMDALETEMKAKYKGEGKEKPPEDLMAAGKALGECFEELEKKVKK